MNRNETGEMPCSVQEDPQFDDKKPVEPTMEQIRTGLQPYYLKKFGGVEGQRGQAGIRATIGWVTELIGVGGVLGLDGERVMPLELIG